MKKFLLLTCYLFLTQITVIYSQTQNIYVSGIGSDISGNGTTNSPFKSLERALEVVTSPGNVTYNLILKPSNGYVSHTKSSNGQLIWTKGGTEQHPINVYSEGGVATIDHVQSTAAMIILRNTSYVRFYSIKFQNATLAIALDNADYCKIEFCEFVGSPISGSGGSGAIWIGKYGTYSESYFENPSKRSDYNIIRNNHFSNLEIQEYEKQHLYHAIYLSNGSIGNDIYFNTMEMGLNIGSGIQMNHGYMNNNNVSSNFVYKTYSSSTDAFMNSRAGINFQWEFANETNFTNGNQVIGNFLYSNAYREFPFATNCDPNNNNNNTFKGPQLLRIRAPLCTNNQISDNALTYGNDEFYEDPLWLEYQADKMSNRMVTGDFDGDSIDDIATLYDNASNNTTLRVWLSSINSFVLSKGDAGWWNAGGYNANKVTGRMVSGDFDGNGFDDIGAFYDYGNNNTRLHIWLSSGTHITYQSSGGWWNTAGYNANKITGRVVSGDFDGNGFDDIGAFYDNGSNNTSLHMWLSSGTHITYQNSSGWWNTSGYNANKITGRVVSGDFDGNGFDDIGAFYDNGSNNTSLHTWLSSGTHITYQNSSGWWNTAGFDPNKITGRVVSGDFNNDGKHDISAFYDYSNYNVSLRSNVWHSTGSNFTYFNHSLGYPWKSLNQNTNSNKSLLIVTDDIDQNHFEITSTNIKAFPNPIKSGSDLSLIYDLEENGNVELVLFDIYGRQIKDISISNQLKGINKIDNIFLEDVSSGIYFLKVKMNQTTKTFKILKE